MKFHFTNSKLREEQEHFSTETLIGKYRISMAKAPLHSLSDGHDFGLVKIRRPILDL